MLIRASSGSGGGGGAISNYDFLYKASNVAMSFTLNIDATKTYYIKIETARTNDSYVKLHIENGTLTEDERHIVTDSITYTYQNGVISCTASFYVGYYAFVY